MPYDYGNALQELWQWFYYGEVDTMSIYIMEEILTEIACEG